MAKYRKKPVVIEAVQWKGYPTNSMLTHLGGSVLMDGGSGFMVIETLEGKLYATPGDWIIRGVKGEYYPCKPDIFEQTYESAPEEENVGSE